MLLRCLIVAATLAALVALFLALRPPDAPESPLPAGTPATPDAPAQTAPQQIRYRIDGATVHGPEVARILQGQRVELLIDSHTDDELHLHGYDLSQRLVAGEPARLLFTAERAGRFALELHAQHRRIGVLEVVPR